MELGEKLRAARLEAGLSQRQLCGEEITRNMLSQIENGSAQPSMKTLKYLAARLGKPLAYFLGEEGMASENQGVMESAWRLYDAGEEGQAALALEGYRWGDPVFDREAERLWAQVHLRMAERALGEGRTIYARELLERARRTGPCPGELERQRLLLWGELTGEAVSRALPSLDRELILRAREALAAGETARAGKLLDAAQDQKGENWLLLRGDVYYREKKYRRAAQCFHAAEEGAPQAAASRLEDCYRELGDFRRAYEYAKKI